jgi:hypothetical protein
MADPELKLVRAFGRTATRRGALAWAGRGLLGLVGFGATVRYLAEITPAAAAHDCSTNPLWCGVYGRSCEHCGGASNACVDYCSIGSYWTRCCCWGDGYCNNISYFDCCGTCTSCSGNFCANYYQPSWCEGAGGGNYVCTFAIVGSAC